MSQQHHIRLLIFLSLLLLLCPGEGRTQVQVQSEYFTDATNAMTEAKKLHAERYAPRAFERAMKKYAEAADDHAQGKNLTDIFAKLKEAIELFNKATGIGKSGEALFSEVRDAQSAAANAEALQYATDLWNKAEREYQKEMAEVEGGDLSGVRQRAKEIEGLYGKAELEAIKTNYLAGARTLLQKCQELDVKQTAPKTFQKATNLLATVDRLLGINRYDTDTARQLASDARYEASHALFLHQRITHDRQEERTAEDYLLEAEQQIQQLMGAAGLKGRFDEGFSKPVASALNAIKLSASKTVSTEDELQSTKDKLRLRDNENIGLKQQVNTLEGQLKESNEQYHQLERRITVQRRTREYLRTIDSLLKGQDVAVESESTSFIIHLSFLKIPPVDLQLPPTVTSILNKAGRAIQLFPGCRVLVEGYVYWDATTKKNKDRSEDQAKIIAEYIMSTIPTPPQIVWTGLGDIRPPATFPSGYMPARNNRFDIVIVPNWNALVP